LEGEVVREEIDIGNRKLIIETGKIAKQAHGAVTVRYGDSMVLVTAVMSPEVKEDTDFLPLLVEYREKAYSAGKIPGGFFKREGRPSEKEIVNARLIDRSIRPLFPRLARNDIQITVNVLSTDQINDPDILGIIGASSALGVSSIPFPSLIGAVRIGKVNGNYIINPTYQQLEESDMDLIVSATKEAIVMIEAGANEVSEDDIIRGIEFARESINKIIQLQEVLVQKSGKPKGEFIVEEVDPEFRKKIVEFLGNRVKEVLLFPSKKTRSEGLRKIFEELKNNLGLGEEQELQAKIIFEDIQREIVREMVLDGNRLDGRKPYEIRPITCEVGVLPRTHGSALFTRGETQSLVVTTLGTAEDKQIIDDIELETEKRFMLHYNFPSFSTGEVKPERGTSRREIGHGALAERAITPTLPSEEEFPYTIRIVSDILESNGSSSMATVCGASLSLMDAGVPVKRAAAGIAMGLVKEGDAKVILTDIAGMEDHFGDMDFKIARTQKGISALQLDLKIDGVDTNLLKEVMTQAREGILFILNKMNQVISKPRKDISIYAPRIYICNIDPKKIGELIGPGGKTIRSIIDETGVKIDVEDDGRVLISSTDEKKAKEALEKVKSITAEAEIGKIYTGKVVRVVDFGAFVEILPGKEGLVHISQIGDKYVDDIRKVIKEGDEILVKVIDIDSQGRIVLSRKQALRQMKEA